MPDPAKPAPRAAPKGAGAGGRAAKSGGGRRFELDRVVVLRVGFVLLVAAFLCLILRVAVVAFGGGGANQAKRVERVVDEATVARQAGPAAAKPPAAPAR